MEEPSIELLKVIERAVHNYPHKALLKFTLSRLFEMKNDIEEALDWNLIQKVVPTKEVLDYATNIAKNLASKFTEDLKLI